MNGNHDGPWYYKKIPTVEYIKTLNLMELSLLEARVHTVRMRKVKELERRFKAEHI